MAFPTPCPSPRELKLTLIALDCLVVGTAMTILNQKQLVAGQSLHFTARKAVQPRSVRTQALFGFGKKKNSEKTEWELEKEEQYRVQQEVLARRKGNSWQKDVTERRARASRYLNDPAFKKICDEENRQKFLAQKAEEEAEPRFGIIIPMAPFGMPEYDGGERFDLRLPYVDNGWVDEDADFGKQIGRFFGMGKKKNTEDEGKGKKKGKK